MPLTGQITHFTPYVRTYFWFSINTMFFFTFAVSAIFPDPQIQNKMVDAEGSGFLNNVAVTKNHYVRKQVNRKPQKVLFLVAR